MAPRLLGNRQMLTGANTNSFLFAVDSKDKYMLYFKNLKNLSSCFGFTLFVVCENHSNVKHESSSLHRK